MDAYLEKYVDLIIRKGINIQKGQKLMITCPVDCAFFARQASEAAYKAGAKDVTIRWIDDKITRIKYLNADSDVFDTFPKWMKLMLDTAVAENTAMLSITASDPENLKGVEVDRLVRYQKVANKALAGYQKKMMANEVQWCVVSLPTEAWAKKVFPKEKTADKAMKKLWEAIYMASRVDENDAVENWAEHVKKMSSRCKKLNKYNFKYLRYKNAAGTDLEVELPEGHIWLGGDEQTPKKVVFSANIPTEEVFTAPKKDGVNGVLVSSKPLIHMGDIIEDFTVEFCKGKVTKVTAKKNQDILEKLLSTTKNADYLGEIALVEYDSPISKSNILFYNTLFDENASCHFAFGNAYPTCVKGTEGLSNKELEKKGINVSMEHTDFMVGSSDLSIIGVTQDGKEVKVFENGNFVF